MPSFVSVKSPNFGSVAQINKEEITNVYKLDNADIQSYYNEQSREYRDKAHQWAEESENVEVQPNEYSAKHYSLKSRQAANDASFAQTKAEQAQALSESAEEAAALSEVNASTSEAKAKSSETSAAESASAASLSESNSKVSELAAKDSENASATSEANAKASELASKNSESASRTSELNASQSATAAATSETNAKTSELAAKSSATNADTSASEARADAIRAEIAADAAASALSPKGDWDASTGLFPSPAMSPERADFYQISVAGTMSNSNAAQPDISVEVGDQLYWNLEKDIWYKIDNTDLVRTVDGMQGDVVIDKYTKAEVNAIESGLQNQIDTITPTSIGALPVNGTANKADKWTNARKITLNGDLTGSVDIDGSTNVTLSASVKNNSHTHSDILAIDDRDVKPNTTGIENKHGAKVFFTSLRGMNGEAGSGDYQDLMVFDTYTDSSGGNVNAITLDKVKDGGLRLWSAKRGDEAWGESQRVFADNYHPNADKWTKARILNLTGDVNGSVSIDGSSDVTLNATVANDSHTHDGRYYTEYEVDVIQSGLQTQINNRATHAVVGIPKDGSYKATGKTSGSETIDFDEIEQAGIYKNLARSDSSNRPDNKTGFAYVQNFTYGTTSNITQLAIPYGTSSRTGRIAIRSRYSGEWQPWDYLYSSLNKPTPNELGAYTTDEVNAIGTGLQNQIDTLDSEVVKTSGAQTISGTKEFSQTLVATSIASTISVDQGLLLFSGGSTRLGGTGSAAGIQLRPNGRDVASDTDYFSFQPNGTVEYEGASNFSISRSGGQHGVFAYADGRTFLTASDGNIELRPKGLSDSSKGLSMSSTGTTIHSHSGGAFLSFRDAVNDGTNSSSYMQWTHLDDTRRGFIGFGSSANNNMTWFNDNGNGNIVLKGDGNVQVDAGTGDTIILSGTSVSDKYQVSGAAGGSWGHSISPALKLTGTNSNFAYNIFQMGDTGAKLQSLGEGGGTVRLFPSGSSSDYIRMENNNLGHVYTGSGYLAWEMTTATAGTELRMRSSGGSDGMSWGYDAVNGQGYINSVDSNTSYRVMTFNSVGSQISLGGTNPGGTELRFQGNFTNTGNRAAIFMDFDNPNDAGTSQLMRSMRETSTATWVWERLSSATIQYTTGTNGNGASQITLDVSNARVGQNGTPTSTFHLTRKDYVDGVASDERLKSNIKTVEDALSIVNQIPVKTYLKEVQEWDEKAQEDKVVHKFEYGFIAQEVEKVLPHLVTEREQDGMKEILRTGNDLHALSFGSIQQLKAENQELKERLAAIEAKLEL
ncbi:tail fiber domain-containing protein [Vibrio diabolicus]|uniref:tail fiber domain-containing protein n=1 Tax=Vibrio diabolicus TaxID=50719 RepID=UPI00211C19B5|nr:tail fiber domain-containing protein [Vibrio diabolicus]MCQ9244266.1 tail fiber domain-containing protein [Vibrio diabolicus]